MYFDISPILAPPPWALVTIKTMDQRKMGSSMKGLVIPVREGKASNFWPSLVLTLCPSHGVMGSRNHYKNGHQADFQADSASISQHASSGEAPGGEE